MMVSLIDIDIDFSHDKIAQQNAKYDFDEVSFKQNLSRARTFGFKSDVDKLKSMGLILGGSLDNAIVLDDDKVINEGGLRFDDELSSAIKPLIVWVIISWLVCVSKVI